MSAVHSVKLTQLNMQEAFSKQKSAFKLLFLKEVLFKVSHKCSTSYCTKQMFDSHCIIITLGLRRF